MDAITNEQTIPFDALLPALQSEYTRNLTALNRTGILTILPESDALGVIGPDGQEYPVPTQEHVHDLIGRNKELIQKKHSRDLLAFN